MGRMQRTKGQVGEREAAEELNRLFGIDTERNGQTKGGADNADLRGLAGVHIEVKRTERLSLYRALSQAIEDSGDTDVPLVLHRASRKPWVAVVRLEDLPALVERLYLEMANE